MFETRMRVRATTRSTPKSAGRICSRQRSAGDNGSSWSAEWEGRLMVRGRSFGQQAAHDLIDHPAVSPAPELGHQGFHHLPYSSRSAEPLFVNDGLGAGDDLLFGDLGWQVRFDDGQFGALAGGVGRPPSTAPRSRTGWRPPAG